MTNYSSLQTCVATAQNLHAQLVASGARVDLAEHNAADYIGPGSSWNQRRAFEWAFLELAMPEHADHCRRRLVALYSAEDSE